MFKHDFLLLFFELQALFYLIYIATYIELSVPFLFYFILF